MAAKHRVLFIATHPVQYQAPLFRLMAEHPRLDIQVAYCSLLGAEAAVDREFGVEVKWDVPLLEGYPWVHVPNRSPWPGLGRFFGLANPGLWKLIASGGCDAVVVYTGYACLSFWIALAAAKFHRKALLFGTDAHGLVPLDGKSWKVPVKRLLWPRIFRLADTVILPSTRGVALMRSLGLAEECLALTPYVVNNEWWTEEADRIDRAAVRRTWGIPEDAPIALLCAKLQRWKRPLDLLDAFVRASVPGSHLVYAGEGPLRSQLESQAISLGVAERVHFLGFTNQSQLPAVYRASDLLVLPSEYEAFGVVVNEAMLCGCGVVLSDRVGAAGDLISAGRNGYVFPCGDVDALAAILADVLPDRGRLREHGRAARDRMQTWSPRENIEAHVRAVAHSILLSGARA